VTPLRYLRAAAKSRPVRRLVFAIAALVLVDRFEPALLRSLEESRYEDPGKDFRFGNSDLFGLGPLVAYLREHPHGRQRRVLFFGNSIIYGYGLDTPDALPAQYQRLDTSAKVFNVGINGGQSVSPFLATKAVIDSVDQVYVLLRTGGAGVIPLFAKLVPVDDEDLALFDLPAPNAAERALAQVANHWRLYRDAYRLQSALFGTSTRQYVYLHKRVLIKQLIAPLRAAPIDSAPSGTITVDEPVAAVPPDADRQAQWREEDAGLWRFADLVVNRRKQVVFLYWPGHSNPFPDEEMRDFNRVFAPRARVLVLHIPTELTSDGMHLTSAGAAELARALWNARPEGDRR
jgi:hypothetical protein